MLAVRMAQEQITEAVSRAVTVVNRRFQWMRSAPMLIRTWVAPVAGTLIHIFSLSSSTLTSTTPQHN